MSDFFSQAELDMFQQFVTSPNSDVGGSSTGFKVFSMQPEEMETSSPVMAPADEDDDEKESSSAAYPIPFVVAAVVSALVAGISHLLVIF